MTQPIRRGLFLLVLLVAVLLTVWWILFEPRRPGVLLRPVPAGAGFFSRHDKLADRWRDISRNPIALSLLHSMGAGPGAFKEEAGLDRIQRMLDFLAADQTAVSFLPASSAYREAWLVASWLGPRSRYLRWWLFLKRPSQPAPVERYGGRSIWRLDAGSDSEAKPFFFTLTEGLLIGCFSSDIAALRFVLDTVDGLHPSQYDLLKWTGPPPSCIPENAPDQGWIMGPDAAGGRRMFFGLSQIRPRALEGSLCFPSIPRAPGVLPGPWRLGPLKRLLSEAPLAIAAVRGPDTGEQLAAWFPVLSSWKDWMPGIQAAMVCILGGEYSGRFKGLKLPGLLVGWPEPDAAKALDRVNAVLDRLNARHQWGLIARETVMGGRRAYSIESVSDTLYARLGRNDRVALVWFNGWLLAAANGRTLDRLLRHLEDSGTTPESCAWASRVSPRSLGFGFLDLERGAGTLRMAMKVYALKQLIEAPERSRRVRQRLNVYRAWLDALAPFERGWIELNPSSEGLVLELRLGKQDQDTTLRNETGGS